MKHTFSLSIVFIFIVNLSISQSSVISWEKTFGGSNYEYAREMCVSSDGGYVAAGYSESADGDVNSQLGAGDCWIVKHSASGTIQWEKTYGGSGFDYASSIDKTTDGGYIIAGYTESTDGDVTASFGNGDCWIFKMDNSGVVLWQFSYGGSAADNAQSICQTSDGGYIVAGYTESVDGSVSVNHGGGDAWIFKLDSNGALIWERSLGGSSYDFAQNIKQTADGGYLLAGGTHSSDGMVTEQNGNGDCWLIKLNSTGDILSQNSFGGSDYDFGQSVEETNDGGFIISGYTESANGDVTVQHGNGDSWVIKCDSAGSIQWQKTLGSSENDYAFSVKQLQNGNYIMIGYSGAGNGDVTGNHGDLDCWLVILDATGAIEMQRSMGGSGVDIGYAVDEISPGNYIVAGYSESNDLDVSANHGNGDCWISGVNVSFLSVAEQEEEDFINAFPNPTSGNVTFSNLTPFSRITVYDASGKIVFTNEETGNTTATMDLSTNAKGVYFYKVDSGEGKESKGKIVRY